jgi:hypothetical protein
LKGAFQKLSEEKERREAEEKNNTGFQPPKTLITYSCFLQGPRADEIREICGSLSSFSALLSGFPTKIDGSVVHVQFLETLTNEQMKRLDAYFKKFGYSKRDSTKVSYERSEAQL